MEPAETNSLPAAARRFLYESTGGRNWRASSLRERTPAAGQ